MIWVNEPEGESSLPKRSLPQHVIDPSDRSPQETEPAETCVNTPAGAVACPESFLPQHTADPSDRSAHECAPRPDTARYLTGSGSLWVTDCRLAGTSVCP